MSFEDATDYMTKYHEKREECLRQNKPLRWFTSETQSYSELIKKKFDRTEENNEWHTKWTTQKNAYDTLLRLRLKVHYLAGAARDLRMQYIGGKQDDREKTINDFIRYEWVRARYLYLMIIKRLKKMLEDKPEPPSFNA